MVAIELVLLTDIGLEIALYEGVLSMAALKGDLLT